MADFSRPQPFEPYGQTGTQQTSFGPYPAGVSPTGSPINYAQNPANPLVYGGYSGGAADWSQYYGGLGQTAYNDMINSGNQIAQNVGIQGANAVNRTLGIGGAAAGYSQQIGEGGAQNAFDTGNNYANAAIGVGQNQAQYANQVGTQAGSELAGLAQNELANQAGAAGQATNALNLEGQAAMGNAPSAAQTLMGQGIGAGLRAEMAGAAGARGGAFGQAAARNQAAQAGGQLTAGGIGQAAQLRANEMAQARGAYGGLASGLYGTSGGLASGYATAAENARLQGLGIGTSAGTAALETGVGAGMQGLGVGTSAATAGAGQVAGLAGETMGAANAADLGFTQAGLGTQLAYTQLGAQERQNALAMQNQVNNAQLTGNLQYNAEALGLAGQTAQIQAAQQQQLVGAGLGAASGFVGGLSDERLKTGFSPQGGDISRDNPYGTETWMTDSAPSTAMPASEQDKSRLIRQNPYGEDFSQYPPGVGPNQPSQPAVPGHSAATLKQMLAGLRGMKQGVVQGMSQTPNLNAAMAPGVTAPGVQNPALAFQRPPVSDERAKQDISPAPTADTLLRMLAHSKSTFAYKNPQDEPLTPQHPHVPGARFGGVMAQDLERVPEIGPQMVTDTPRGKQLEPGAVQGAVLMGLGRLAERVAALEGKGGKRAA